LLFEPMDLIRPSAPPQPPRRRGVFIDMAGALMAGGHEDAPFRPAVGPALAALADAGFALVVVTAHSALARGQVYERERFAKRQARLQAQLREEAGVSLTDFVVCPHALGAGGQPACLCHKPAPGLIHRAARRHGIDSEASWMVGATLDDVEAGRRAGCRSVLLDDGREALDPGLLRSSPLRRPDACCADWDEVVELLLSPPRPQARRLHRLPHSTMVVAASTY
jgi:D-glycero-D-manno-heptose 1,7-bisphosphate phosphatase